MLALTLAVGIVIDDAIVVLENIYRFIEEKELDPFDRGDRGDEGDRPGGARDHAVAGGDLRAGRVHGRHRRPLHGELRPDDGVRDHGVAAGQLHADADDGGALAEGRPDTAAKQHSSKDSRVFHADRRVATRGCSSGPWRTAAIVAGVAVLVLLSSVPLFMMASKNFLPADDQAEFEINLRAPEGTSLEATEVIDEPGGQRRARRGCRRWTTRWSRSAATSPARATWRPIYVRLTTARRPDARSVRRHGRRARARSCRRSPPGSGRRCSRWRPSAAAARRTPTSSS